MTLLALFVSVCGGVPAFAAEKAPGPTAHSTRNIEGWTVRVDDRLLKGDIAAVGERALKLLTARLVAITFVVPEKSLAKMRTITIELDLNYGDLRVMQYHPDAGWLKEHGYSEKLAKCVPIPTVEDFLEPEGIHSQPWVVLHELAHGFHDQTIGFDDPRVIAAWKKFCDSGKYKSVLTVSGKKREHYGLTDEKEFFAEMTESYFGSNDFYPFVAGELKQAEPDLFALLAEIWGPLPGFATSKATGKGAVVTAADAVFEVKPVSREQAAEYKLDANFYKKCTLVQNILIATSEKVPDVAHFETAYLLDKVMGHLIPPAAQRIRDKKVLCVLVGPAERLSDVPQFATDKKGKELDLYNWRNRGQLTDANDRPTFVFAEEDVMEYPGGMDMESILIHEFAHVIDGVGFDKTLQERLHAAFKHAKDKGLYMDGYAAQKFRRVKSETPVSLLDALAKSFPDQKPKFLRACLHGGDILVNGKPTQSDVKVTKDDKVLIVFGGPKQTYWMANKAEYWAEGVQAWYDTCRTMDHDHNHIHTRDQLKVYDPELAKLIADVLGDNPWRFVSPRNRAGTGHLAGYDPTKAPHVVDLEDIDLASQDYYDEYWKDFWKRLHEKYPENVATPMPRK